jgi:uncharacterized membrane protein YpjA
MFFKKGEYKIGKMFWCFLTHNFISTIYSYYWFTMDKSSSVSADTRLHLLLSTKFNNFNHRSSN